MDEVKRTEEGRFLKGVSGNPAGRPAGRKNEIIQLKQEVELAIRQHVHTDKLKKVVEKVLNKAMNGNMAAAKLILDHFVTKATDADESGLPNGGIRIVIENATFAAKAATPVTVVETTYEEIPMSTGAKPEAQKTGADASGGNIVNKGPTDHRLHQPPNFQGKSGQPDNQSTSRPKGTT